MKKNFMLLLAFLAIQWVQAQIVNIPDANFKNALLNHDPIIDTNNDGEIQVSEALATLGLDLEEQAILDPTGIEAFENLTSLNFEYNQLTAIDLSNNLAIEYLNLSRNQFTSLDITALTELRYFWARFNEVTSIDLSQNVELRHLDLYGNMIGNIDLSPHGLLELLNLGGNEFESLDLSANTNIEQLYVSNNSLSAIDVSMMPNLDKLVIGHNQFSTIDLSGNPLLTFLDVTVNELTTIDLSNNTELFTLWAGSNQITDIDLSNNPLLDYILLESNDLDELDLSNNLEAENVTVSYNNLTELDVTALSDLTFLAINGNPMTSIDVSQNPDLYLLAVFESPIEQLDVSANPLLESLYAFETALTELDLSANEALVTLLGSDNPSLSFVNLRNGNNEILNPDLLGCPLLQFICVDDVAYAQANFTQVPPGVTFVENCDIGTGEFNTITGTVSFDEAGDGCDGNDLVIANLLVAAVGPDGDLGAATQLDGVYDLSVFEGTYTTSILGLPDYFSTTPETYEHTFTGFDQTEIADFCIVADEAVDDLVISLIPIDEARPGFDANYLLTYENIGSTSLDVSIDLTFDEVRVAFGNSDPLPDEVFIGQLSWSPGIIGPFESRTIPIRFVLEQPPVNESGDILSYSVSVVPDENDATPEDNSFDLDQVIVNSFDPNDKMVAQGEEVLIDDADQFLHYTVRFQNVGTASAINVRIEDQLDDLLDWTTFRLLESSHPMEITIQNGLVYFWFEEINLPSVDDDPEGSQGYVVFKIKPMANVQLGDMIQNTASIYFDFNPAIITNTVSTTFVEDLGTEKFNGHTFSLYPNPASALLNVQSEIGLDRISLYAIDGQKVKTVELTGRKTQIDISGLAPGLYFVQLHFQGRQVVSSKLVIR